jgi:hypothetical protein
VGGDSVLMIEEGTEEKWWMCLNARVATIETIKVRNYSKRSRR